jgi:CRISPR-associated protein Cas1
MVANPDEQTASAPASDEGSPSASEPDLVPARILNEFAYCPRLAYIEWVEGEFADSADTVDGRRHHRRVDKETGAMPEAPALAELGPGEKLHARSVYLSAPRIGLVARVDLVEASGTCVTPIDYKRGEAPDVPEGAWEPERVQVCAQGLILEENGYACDQGILYFAGSRRRVAVPFTPELRARTLGLLAELREVVRRPQMPAPLVDSPKCPRCSLVGICLPDEVNLLRLPRAEDEPTSEPRRLLPARDDALPLYVQASGARVGKHNEELVITPREGPKQTARLGQTSQLAVFGNVQISTQAIQTIAGRGIPICYYSAGGWFYGMTIGSLNKNVELRRLQFRTAEDPERSLAIARRLISAKIRNCRTLFRRNADDPPARDVAAMRDLAESAEQASSAATLLGIEGTAARIYYQGFPRLLRAEPGTDALGFDFEGRNRRPPRDPINALLSPTYALLTKDVTLAVQSVGFDPFLGFFHRPRYGRPALALDLMEEFRPLIGDSVVLTAVNTGAIRRGDFVQRAGGVSLTEGGRTRLLRLYERRMDELVTHSVFGYRISYRRVLEVQARLLARFLAGEIPAYPGFITR